jgi:hypothetical protein
VLSSAADLDDDVLQEAVQGLARICFPEGVLDELGIDIVTAHMVRNGASPCNIDRTKALFNEAMIHRMAEMMAPYLDTPRKLDNGTAAVVSAAQRLHGPGFEPQGADLNPETAEGPLKDENEYIVTRQQSPQEEASPPTTSSKKKRNRKLGQDQCAHETDTALIKVPGDAEEGHAGFVNKDKKVSKSWRWNVDQGTVSDADTSNIFRRTGDLFAYHALPIIRRELGPSTKKKPLREKLETMLSDMPHAEYQQWLDSRDKLWAGDLRMLTRVSSEVEPIAKGFTRATPAPSTHQFLRGGSPVEKTGRFLRDTTSIQSAVVARFAVPHRVKQDVTDDSNHPTLGNAAVEEPHRVSPGSDSTVLARVLTKSRHPNSTSIRP